MNESVGTSFALSFLCVAVVAVALYRPDPPPAADRPPHLASRDRPTPSEPEVSRPELAQAHAPAPVEPEAEGSLAEVETRPGRPRSVRPVAHRSPIQTPTRPFTRVLPGETLDEVALRVYGSSEARERLWRANRDQVEGIDSALHAGSLLRTPED